METDERNGSGNLSWLHLRLDRMDDGMGGRGSGSNDRIRAMKPLPIYLALLIASGGIMQAQADNSAAASQPEPDLRIEGVEGHGDEAKVTIVWEGSRQTVTNKGTVGRWTLMG